MEWFRSMETSEGLKFPVSSPDHCQFMSLVQFLVWVGVTESTKLLTWSYILAFLEKARFQSRDKLLEMKLYIYRLHNTFTFTMPIPLHARQDSEDLLGTCRGTEAAVRVQDQRLQTVTRRIFPYPIESVAQLGFRFEFFFWNTELCSLHLSQTLSKDSS